MVSASTFGRWNPQTSLFGLARRRWQAGLANLDMTYYNKFVRYAVHHVIPILRRLYYMLSTMKVKYTGYGFDWYIENNIKSWKPALFSFFLFDISFRFFLIVPQSRRAKKPKTPAVYMHFPRIFETWPENNASHFRITSGLLGWLKCLEHVRRSEAM